MIRVVVVDDEPLARQGIRLRLAGEPGVTVVGEAADGPAAVRTIAALLPDLVFLDVQMPGMDGFEVLEKVVETHLPVFVFVTAWDRYAIRAFEVEAIDYLLKPLTQERFQEAMRRARRELRVREESDGSSRVIGLLDRAGGGGPWLERFAVRAGDRYRLVKTADVDYFRAAANYVEVHAGGRVSLVRSTLSHLEGRLVPGAFARIHRSIIVNVDRVAEVRPDAHGDYGVVLKDGTLLRMTRRFSDRLLVKV